MHEALASPRSARLLAADLAPGDKLRANFPERDVVGTAWTVTEVIASATFPDFVVVRLESQCFPHRVERMLLSAYEEVVVWHRTCQGCGKVLLAPAGHWTRTVPECSYCFDGVARSA